MGNVPHTSSDDGSGYHNANDKNIEHFVIKFIKAVNPNYENRSSQCNPYLRCYLSVVSQNFSYSVVDLGRHDRISPIMTTPTRMDSKSTTVWNCYRNFFMTPPADSYLTVEMMNAAVGDNGEMMGYAHIPISKISDGSVVTIDLIMNPGKNLTRQKKKHSIQIFLQRLFAKENPPRHKILYLIRHGESKWNKAQASANVGGLLNRDHALTEAGIRQAMNLNSKWKIALDNITLANLVVDLRQDWEDVVSEAMMGGLFTNVGQMSPQESVDHLEDIEKTASLRAYGRQVLIDNFQNGQEMSSDSNTRSNSNSDGDERRQQESFQAIHQDFQKNTKAGQNNSNGPQLLDFNDFEFATPIGGNIVPVVSIGHEDSHDHIIGSNSSAAAAGTNNCKEESDDEFWENYQPRDGFSLSGTSNESSLITPGMISSNSSSGNRKRDGMRIKSVASMLTTLDAITEQRRQEYIAKFMQADAVVSSPLTRAIQTAIMSMEGHTAISLEGSGLTLYSQIREVKNVGGFDTVGVAVGPPEIEQRFVSELSSVLGRRRVLDAMPSVINYNDCNQPWWNPISSYESDTEQQDRVLEFINYARYCDFKTPVFVGHSLFFKAFYSRRVSKLLATYRPELAENMRKYRLSNATLLAVHVLFSDDLDGDALILDADILFDGGFHHEGHKQRGQEEDGEPILSASTSGKQHSGNAFLDLSRFSDFGSNFDKIAIRDVVPSSMKDYIPDFKSEIKSFSKKFMGSFS